MLHTHLQGAGQAHQEDRGQDRAFSPTAVNREINNNEENHNNNEENHNNNEENHSNYEKDHTEGNNQETVRICIP